MDPLRLCLALTPLAAYLLVVGWLCAGRRPVLVGGMRDTAALGLALFGMAVIGPIELFMPRAAAYSFGPLVWVLLAALYTMGLLLVMLLERPRLVLYNLSAEELRPVLSRVVEQLDSAPRWAGNSVALPTAELELRITPSYGRTVTVSSANEHPPLAAWRQLHARLTGELSDLRVQRNLTGTLQCLVVGLLLIAITIWTASREPAEIAQSLSEMLLLDR